MVSKHILYLTQYYASDKQSGGLRHYAHVNALVSKGYKVSLVISYVDHMKRAIPQEYQSKKIFKEEINKNLTIYKVYAFPHYGKDVFSRLRNMCSYSYYAFLAAKKIKKIDLMIISSPPLTLGVTAFFLSLLKKTKFIFEVRDLWPDTPIVMGSLKNKFLINCAKIIEKVSYKNSCAIIGLTEGMCERIIAKNVPNTKVFFIPNGADLDLYKEININKPKGLIRESDKEFIVTYAGVHSTYPDLQNLINTANQLKSYSNIKFAFVGDGDNKPLLLKMKEKMSLKNVHFYEKQPKKEIPDILASTDVCIVSYQNLEFWRHAFPNKTFDYMASSRPIISSVLEGEITNLIKSANCGICIEPGNPQKLSEAILWMYNNQKEALEMGNNGRKYVEEYYNRSIIIHNYLSLIEKFT